MKLKKGITSIILALVMLCTSIPSGVMATDAVGEDVVSPETYEQIEMLYALRSQMAVDYEKNESEIEKIDNELEALGVKTISEEALIKKLNANSPMPIWEIVPSDTVRWDEVRTNTVYNGTMLQLQIVRGVPISDTGELVKSDLTAEKVAYFNFGQVFKKAFILSAKCAAGFIPGFGGALSVGFTFYDIFNEIIDGLETTTTIENVTLSYTANLVADEIYVFVKYQGAVDLGNQILSYIGNKIQVAVGVSIPKPIMVDGRLFADVSQSKVNSEVTSESYEEHMSVACKNFWDYEKKGKDFLEDYRTTEVTFTAQYLDSNGKEKQKILNWDAPLAYLRLK